jgi:hypothetical protein
MIASNLSYFQGQQHIRLLAMGYRLLFGVHGDGARGALFMALIVMFTSA